MVDTDKREMIDKSNQLEVIEQAAKIAIRLTAVPRDLLGPPSDSMKSRAALGEKIADAIRSIPPIVTAIPKASAALTAAPVQVQEPVAEFGHDSIFVLRKQANGERFPKGTKLYAAPAQPVAVPDGVPSFYKKDRVEVRNPFGHIYSGVITKAETRWGADKRPYVIYQVRADGEKTSSQVVPSQIMTIAAPAALGDAQELPAITGFGRFSDSKERGLLVTFERRLTDKEMECARVTIAAKVAS